MKKCVKLFAVLLAVLLMLSCFAACTKTEQPGKTTGENEATTGGDNATPETPTTEDSGKDPAPEKPIEIRTALQLSTIVETLNNSPDASVGKTYKLMADIEWAADWKAAFSLNGEGKMNKPGAVSEWKPISKFYGTFDGNGKTISGLYADSKKTDGMALFGELCDGATVKDLTFDNSFLAAKGGTVAGLAGTVSGNVTIENVVVNSYLFTEAGSLAGLVGKVNGTLTLKKATFAGVLGTVDADLKVPSAKTDIVIGQMIADGADKTITMDECLANGLIYTSATSDAWCAKGATNVTKTGCTVQDSILEFSENAILIRTAEELMALSSMTKKDAEGNTVSEDFEGKIIKLMNDIDLNPGWSSATTVVGKDGADPTTVNDVTVTFPTAPANKFRPIKKFAGTFDGQGFTIKGLYIDYLQIHDSTESTKDGFDIYPNRSLGFVANNSGVIKNIVFTNGIIIGRCDTTNIRIGSVVGTNSGTVQNIYSDMELWAANKTIFNNVGGMCGRLGSNAMVSDCVFAGKIGSLDGPNVTNKISSVSTYVSGVAGSCGNATGTIKNCLNLSTFYHGNKGNKTDFGSEAGNMTMTNNLSGKKDASFLTGEDGTAYAEDWEYNETLGCVVPKTISAMFQ